MSRRGMFDVHLGAQPQTFHGDVVVGVALALFAIGNLVLPEEAQTVAGLDYLVLILAVLATAVLVGFRRLLMQPTSWLIVLTITIVALPGLLAAPLGPYGVSKLQTLVIIVLLILAASTLRDVERGARITIGIVSAVAAAMVVLVLLLNETTPSGRMSVFELSPIAVARACAWLPVAAVLVSVVGTRRLVVRLLMLPLAALGAGAAFITGSRGPLVSAGVAIVVALMILVVVRQLRVVWFATLFLGGAGLAALGLALSGNIERLLSRGDSGRSELVETAWEAFLQNPLGIGWGRFATVAPEWVEPGSDVLYPHNLFLELLLEGGVVALIGFSVIFTVVFIWLAKSFVATRGLAGLLVLAMYVYALVNAQFSSDLVGNRMFWVALALGVAMKGARPEVLIGAVQSPKGLDSNRVRRIVIVEERSSGHLLVYVRLLAIEARARGDEVLLALGSGVETSIEYSREPVLREFETIWFSGAATARLVDDLTRTHRPDRIIVPHGDELAVRMALRVHSSEVDTRVLIMRDPRWERPARISRHLSNAVKMLLIGVLEHRRHVRVIWLRGAGYAGSERFAIDPFIDGDEGMSPDPLAPEVPALDTGRFWFVVTGAITDRKNVPLIIEAMGLLGARRAMGNVGLALIGPLRTSQTAQRLAELADSAGVHLVIIDQILTNSQMNGVVRDADAVVMAYSTHSPNSTMVKAHVLGARLVVAGAPSIRSFARNLGYEAVELDAQAVATALGTALDRSAPGARPNPAPVSAFVAPFLEDGAV